MNKTHRLEPNLNTLTTAQLEEMSTIGFNFNLPVCTATQNNYFVKNGLLANDLAEFSSIFPTKAVQIANAGKRQIQFWCTWRTFGDADDIQQLISPLMGQINGQITSSYNQIRSYQIVYIPGSSFFAIHW